MERKFESDIGVRISEGKRGASRKAILGISAIAACALLFGAASYSFAVSENAPVEITELPIFVQAPDEYAVLEEGDVDLARSMSLKYRSTLPPGNGDSGNTKLIYSVNMQVKSTADIDFADLIAGELSVMYQLPVTASVTIACTVTVAGEIPISYECAIGEYSVIDSVVVVDASVPTELITGYDDVLDENGDVVSVPVTVEYTVADGDSISWLITVAVSIPDLLVTLTEDAWPALVDITRSWTNVPVLPLP